MNVIKKTVTESKDHGLAKAGETLGDMWSNLHASQSRLSRTMSRKLFNNYKERDSTASLDKLCLFFSHPYVKVFPDIQA